ncbi:kinase-associated lipoprotein B [Caldibacillus lycopersici]|uniref:Kinase-associated lipoprotein B n=1 Tax=Perspicuibacillus lycopersici TaxID=1325689 RepID=A0AAE3IQK6_9BACI|nr:kinase-associated lipoprotein B [Perspicuibacillus lycopersici]MCU9612770.1 kinase-associated lipoprotein B [Perspicuibacillus lycopersici]
MKESIPIGSIVRAHNKTGTYIGEVTADKDTHYLVKILAVVKHPMQGDLHHPKQVEVPFFHERKALAYREQTNVPKTMVKPFEGEIPEYQASLQAAVNQMIEALESDDSPFASQSLQCMRSLVKEYNL